MILVGDSVPRTSLPAHQIFIIFTTAMTFLSKIDIIKRSEIIPLAPVVRFLYILLLVLSLSIRLGAQEGPLGEWPDFTPLGFITAPHPQDANYQTHLYGDWGGIVGEEFLGLQDGFLKLFYHSYHSSYLTKLLFQEHLLQNWTLGYNPNTLVKFSPLVKPGGPNPGSSWNHTDTPGYILHPLAGEHLLYYTARPGTKYLHPEWNGLSGWEGAIQVASSESAPEIGIPFVQDYKNILEAELWWEKGWNQNGTIKGGLSEPTPVWVPHLGTSGKVRLFYRGLNSTPGSYYNWRISYADSEDGKTNWVKNPVPSWDPSDPENPAYQWTLPWPGGFSFRGSWQAHVTGDTIANGVHMVLMVSNQNYAGYGHIAYYWSPDWGDNWIGHPDNPIIAPGQFPDGVPDQGFQRTPTLVVDDVYNRYILAYNAGHDIEKRSKRHTYIATAARPVNTSNDKMQYLTDFKKVRNYPNPFSSSTTISFSIPERGLSELAIYNMNGRRVRRLINQELYPGDHTVLWNGKDDNDQTMTSGIYFYVLNMDKFSSVGKMILK
ncbi:MAG: T9SS type A sorting domain-containing protein [Bacteroidetes bacterium]|nr:T9SS type A sorting domain-containing protein [Bacteroidota bacterium]MBT4401227.1 T9SS type A sorting domain-containing protein [Bacteroidota bacterium]MBT5426065.1 T9SS type A sorting domain-containing protein [Bacteroidota bacterium]MBT7465953.1 T9SS type A sorting domain-containing protein [Bacteroidota bacterium]